MNFYERIRSKFIPPLKKKHNVSKITDSEAAFNEYRFLFRNHGYALAREALGEEFTVTQWHYGLSGNKNPKKNIF